MCSLKGLEENIVYPNTFWKGVNWGRGLSYFFSEAGACLRLQLCRLMSRPSHRKKSSWRFTLLMAFQGDVH